MFILFPTVFLSMTLARAMMTDDLPYCAARYRRLCQGKGKHVACQFAESGPGYGCENYKPINFTMELKHFVIHYLNRRRQKIASGQERVRGGARLPRPQVMMMVEWDRELAMLAQRLADQCTFAHDDCRATVRYPYAGQTVGEVRWRGMGADSEALGVQRAIRRVLDAWWGERRRATPEHLIQPFKLNNKGSVWGHFSQLAVWSLRGVGCGAVLHGSGGGGGGIRLLLVCDFSHTNMLGQRTLPTGPLAQCPNHSIRRSNSPYPLLCAPVRHSRLEQDSDEDHSYNPYDDLSEEIVETKQKTEEFVTTESSKNTRIQSKNTRPSYRNSHRRRTTIKIKSRTRVDEPAKNIDDENVDKWRTVRPRSRKLQRGRHRQSTTTTSHNKYEELFETEDSNAQEEEPQSHLNSSFTETPEFIDVTESQYSTQESMRQRWKQTRNRPRRPGATALLQTTQKSIGTDRTSRRTAMTLGLDVDDMEQFYRDTGFNVKNPKQK